MRNAVILGSGRSGTSMLAGLFAHAGYYVGDDPYPGRESNPKGFFETKAINGINEGLIARALPRNRDRDLGAWQRWLATVPVGTRFTATPEDRERMQRLVSRQPFCFKDPRFSYTLEAWREAFGDARYLCVFRHPAATAKSIVRECSQADYLTGVSMDLERALEIWVCMYRHIIEVQRHVGEWMFVHFDQVLTPEGQGRIEAFVETPLARDFPEARLEHSRAETPVTREAAEIYRELCRLAGFAAQAIEVRSELPAPWPLATAAPIKLLACPDYATDDVEHVMREFAPHMVGRDDVCLVLRHDEDADGPLADAQRAVEDAYALCFPANEPLNVLFFDDRVDERDRSRLELSFDAALVLSSAHGARHETLLRGTRLPMFESGEALATHLSSIAAA